MKEIYEARIYVAQDGKAPFSEWMKQLKDLRGKAAIRNRIDRLTIGNFGDCKHIEASVWELRINFGPGYRVYLAKEGAGILLLLCGGDKGSQKRDVAKAMGCWNDYRRRKDAKDG